MLFNIFKKNKKEQVGHVADPSFIHDPDTTPTEKVAIAFMHYYADSLKDKERERILRTRRNYMLIAFAFSGIIASVVFNANKVMAKWPPDTYAAVVNIEGPIGAIDSAKGAAINAALKTAFEDPKAKRIVLRINSPGGTPYDSESVIDAMRVYRIKNPKPVDSVIEGIGASAAYMIAVHTDKIYAGRYTLTGSVGAMMGTWNFHKLTDKYEVENQTFVSGKLKDMLNPYRPTRNDEKGKVQDLVDTLANTFADEVIKARGNKLKLTKEALQTGEVWVGSDALKLGLIDEIGTLSAWSQKHDLVLDGVGPHEDKGMYIPRFSAFIDMIIGKLKSSLSGVTI